MPSGSVVKNGERYPASNCILRICGCSLAPDDEVPPPRITPDPSVKRCSSNVASFAAIIANPHMPVSGLQLAEFAVGVVFRLTQQVSNFGLRKLIRIDRLAGLRSFRLGQTQDATVEAVGMRTACRPEVYWKTTAIDRALQKPIEPWCPHFSLFQSQVAQNLRMFFARSQDLMTR